MKSYKTCKNPIYNSCKKPERKLLSVYAIINMNNNQICVFTVWEAFYGATVRQFWEAITDLKKRSICVFANPGWYNRCQ
jgi:hypothetical protein